MHISEGEGRALRGLLESASGDIVIRLDSAGFVQHASANAADLGLDLASLLLMPHISDFTTPDRAREVAGYVASVFANEERPGWLEFPVLVRAAPEGGDDARAAQGTCRWYALGLRLIDHDNDAPPSALGLLSPVHHTRLLDSEMAARALTDPVTGLANRHAFCASLRRHLGTGGTPTIAVFAVDRMRALIMQYGQATADEILWGFGRFLDSMVVPGQELAQLDDERFAVLLPAMPLRAARAWTADVLQTFAGLAMGPRTRTPELTASAGLARVELSVDWTLRQAELGLVMARAGGGMQARVCGRPIRAEGGGAAVVIRH
jgi:GGDEF domain-containing protein